MNGTEAIIAEAETGIGDVVATIASLVSSGAPTSYSAAVAASQAAPDVPSQPPLAAPNTAPTPPTEAQVLPVVQYDVVATPPSTDNLLELQSAVAGLADGVQSLTALIEAQTPSSKIENQIASLQSALSLQVSNQSYNASAYVPLGDGAPNTIAAASNIGTISGAAITNLTASEIPNLSGSYLSLNGGTVAGTTTITSLSVGSANTGVAPFFVGGKSTGSVVGPMGQALAWNSDSSMVARATISIR